MADHPLIPPMGTVSQAERMFRLNWVASLERSPSGVPLHSVEYVARQGPRVRLIDIRNEDEIIGPLGYIPGSDWLPRATVDDLRSRFATDDPVVLISRGGERAAGLADAAEKAGLRYVAALRAGILAWHDLGYRTIRDPGILERRGQTRPAPEESARAGGHLTLEEIEGHVGKREDTRWIKLAAVLMHARCACVDGRDDTAVIGTPGGDVGELVLALDGLEHVIERPLTEGEVAALIVRCADALGSLYMHSDVTAANSLIMALRADDRLTEAIGDVYEPLEWRKWVASPPAHVRDIVLDHLLTHGNLGCGHLKLMMQHPERYAVRADLVKGVVRAWMHHRWSDAPQLQLVVLPGGHEEGAVVLVEVEDDLHAYTPIPLISPSCAGSQMFVHHPQVIAYLRKELAALLCEQGDVIPVEPGHAAALAQHMERLGAQQMGVTLELLANGLPIFGVVFGRNGGFRVEARGHVGS
ncbi:MAG: hypothetical protein H6736_00505 [Alphaproteobacteria bacterium]|nr:hypothetical protein [Alphaproteobacteria bacterium]